MSFINHISFVKKDFVYSLSRVRKENTYSIISDSSTACCGLRRIVQTVPLRVRWQVAADAERPIWVDAPNYTYKCCNI